MNSCLNSRKSTSPEFQRAITTMSMWPRVLPHWRNISLKTLFTLFRMTAFPTFFETISPIRLSPWVLGVAQHTKSLQIAFSPWARVILYSEDFKIRFFLGKFFICQLSIGERLRTSLPMKIESYFLQILTDKLALPLALRLFKTLRPPGVAILLRKP